jgi:5-methylcytosine-specific restriction endonuclease McrA
MGDFKFKTPDFRYLTGLSNRESGNRKKCPPHLKSQIRNRWWGDSLHGSCFCCGKKIHYDDADPGHIKADSKGGKWSPENCRLICRTCNSGMRNMNMKTYMKRYYPERYEKYFPKGAKEKKKIMKTRRKRRNTSIFGSVPTFKEPKFKW